MRLSTRARYGARFMLGLALHYGNGPRLLKDIAREQEISEKSLTQLGIPLKARGLINASRGAHGGYTLAREPSRVTLKEIVAVLEGDLTPVECARNTSACTRIASCVTREVWVRVGERIAETLNAVTLEDLVRKYRRKEKKVAMYNI